MHGEENWCYKPEELLHHRRLVQCLLMVIGAGLGGRWTTMGTGSLHFFWVKLVVERALSRPARGGVVKSQKRTLLLLLLAGHVAVSPQGHAGRLWTAESSFSAFARPRQGASTKPRTTVVITTVMYVLAVSVWELHGGCHALGIRPGGPQSGRYRSIVVVLTRSRSLSSR